MKRTEIKALTGIRGVAALAVALHHLMPQSHTTTSPLRVILVNSYMAVDLFFLLSGFVMAMTYGDMFTWEFSFPNYKRYLRQRFARTYPLYAVCTLVMFSLIVLGLVDSLETHRIWYDLLPNLALIQAWGRPWWSIDNPGWSISTEWAAYFLFPQLVLLGLWVRPAITGMAALLAYMVVIGLSLVSTELLQETGWRSGPLDISQGMTLAPLLRCLAEFFLGIVVYRLSATASVGHGQTGERWYHTLASPRFASLLTDVAAAGAVCVLALRGFDVLAIPMFALTILGLAISRDSVTSRFLSWRPIYGLGVISYSIYLVHEPIADFVSHVLHAYGGLTRLGPMATYRELARLGAIATVPLAIAIIPIATLTYFGIEKPARRWLAAKSAMTKPDLAKPYLAVETSYRRV